MDWSYWIKGALLGIIAIVAIYIIAKLIGEALMEGFIKVAKKHNKEAKDDGEKGKKE